MSAKKATLIDEVNLLKIMDYYKYTPTVYNYLVIAYVTACRPNEVKLIVDGYDKINKVIQYIPLKKRGKKEYVVNNLSSYSQIDAVIKLENAISYFKELGSINKSTYELVRKTIQRDIKLKNIPNFALKDLRTSALTRAITYVNGDVASISKAIGHSNMNTTMKYFHKRLEDNNPIFKAGFNTLFNNYNDVNESDKDLEIFRLKEIIDKKDNEIRILKAKLELLNTPNSFTKDTPSASSKRSKH